MSNLDLEVAPMSAFTQRLAGKIAERGFRRHADQLVRYPGLANDILDAAIDEAGLSELDQLPTTEEPAWNRCRSICGETCTGACDF